MSVAESIFGPTFWRHKLGNQTKNNGVSIHQKERVRAQVRGLNFS